MLELGKKISRYLTLFIGVLLTLVCLFGCGSKQRIPIERIYFPNKTYEAVVGETFKVEPIIEPANAYTGDLRWYTEELDRYTASVDDEGNVIAHHVGRVNIHVYDQNNHANHAFYDLHVSNPPSPPSLGEMRASIEDSLNEIAVSSQSRLSLSFNSSPIDGYVLTKRVSISSQDSSIAEVIVENGVFFIQGKMIGKTTLHIVDNYKKCKDLDYEITVREPYLRAITLPNEYIYLISTSDTYKSFDLKPQAVTLGNVNAILSFSSSDSTIVSVDNNGHLLAKKEGRAIITVSSKDVSTTCEAIVSEDNSKLPAEGAIKLGEDQDERFAITALLERYAYEHFVGGLPILANENDDGIQSPIKLNLNTCTEREWERYFGVAGSRVQTPKEDYWEVEPAMSNRNFLNGLTLAIDRVRLAEKSNLLPTVNLMNADPIMNDDYTGSWDTTYLESSYHQAVINDRVKDTDGYGYSFDRAKQYFINASNELINEGIYKAGDVIEIEIAWMNEEQIQNMHKYIKEDLEKAFNVADNPLTLNVVSYVGEAWSDAFYKKTTVGKYDISYGTISSSVISWRNLSYLALAITNAERNYWCLNFGKDTNDLIGELEYQNKLYSFEALLTASNIGAFINRGMYQDIPILNDLSKTSLSFNDNNQMVLDTCFFVKYAEEISYDLIYSSIYSYNSDNQITQIFASEINKVGEADSRGWQKYQIVFDRNEISAINNETNQMAFNRGDLFVDLGFKLNYFSDPQEALHYHYYVIPLNDLVNNFSDLFI